MKKYYRLIQQSVWMLAGKIGSQLALVMITILLARGLGPTGFGEYAMLAAVIVIGNSLTTFGTDMYLIREIASKSDYSSLAPILLIQIALSGLFITLVWLFAPLIPKLSQDGLVALRIYVLALIPLALFSVNTTILRGEQRMAEYTWLNLANAMIQFLAILVSGLENFGIIQIVGLLLISQIIIALVGSWMCFPQLRAHVSVSWRLLDEANFLLKKTSAVAGISFLRILYQRVSLIILSFLGGALMSGWFSAATRTLEAARIGHGSVFTALFPIMASSGEEFDQETMHYFAFPFYVLLVFAFAGSSILIFLARPLIELLFGPGYQNSILPLKILSISLIPYTINDYLSIALLSLRREIVLSRILLLSVILMIVADLIVIPRFGFIGASWTFCAIEFITSIILAATWKTYTRPHIGYEKAAEQGY